MTSLGVVSTLDAMKQRLWVARTLFLDFGMTITLLLVLSDPADFTGWVGRLAIVLSLLFGTHRVWTMRRQIDGFERDRSLVQMAMKDPVKFEAATVRALALARAERVEQAVDRLRAERVVIVDTTCVTDSAPDGRGVPTSRSATN